MAVEPHLVLAFGLPSGSEWLWIALIALLLFGGAKLPSLMRSMGGSIKEFKKGMDEGIEKKPDDKKPDDAPPKAIEPPKPPDAK